MSVFTALFQWRSHCGCRGCKNTPKIQIGFWKLAFKLHNWCIQVTLLLLEICDIGKQVACELFITPSQ